MNDPKWVPCAKRQEVVLHNKDGSKGQLCRCAHQAASRFNKEVTPADCEACPLRLITKNVRPAGYTELQIGKREYVEPTVVDGCLVYKPNGLKPPSVPNGYRRKGEEGDDAWVFEPLWPACQDREMANTVQRCGQLKINALCASKESSMKGLPVLVDNCNQCPVRRMLLEQVDVKQGPV